MPHQEKSGRDAAITMEQLTAHRHIAAPAKISVPTLRCLFCGGADLVATPIWPDWLDRQCPASGSQNQAVSPAAPSSPPFLACTRCSSGWMARLEGQAEMILRPILEGSQNTVTGGQMKMLAGWLCLQAIKLAAENGACRIPLSDRSHLRHTGQPPQSWGMFVAGFSEPAASRSCQHHPCRIEFSGNPIAGHSRGRPPGACNSQMLSIGLGRLFFHLFSSPSLITLHDFAAASRREGLTRIWPPSRRFGIVPYREMRLPPPGLTLTEQEARRVAAGFAAALKDRLRA